jgi:solute carrier family 25 carnitine/acylcarnitine transporter 20/29
MVVADLVAGTIAGFGICATGHPFDTVKVLMQMQPGVYKGGVDATRQTLARYGPAGLYRGVAAPLVGNGFYNAVQFAVFSAAKRAFTDDGRKLTLNRIAAAGAFTGIFVAFVEGPQDLFKSQMQAQMMHKTAGPGAAAPAAAAPGAAAAAAHVRPAPVYKGTLDCARTILRERGLAGATQGLTATIARNMVGVCAYFYVYEAMRMQLARGRPVSELSSLQVLLAGGMGG